MLIFTIVIIMYNYLTQDINSLENYTYKLNVLFYIHNTIIIVN